VPFLRRVLPHADLPGDSGAASSETAVLVGVEGRGVIGRLGFRDSIR